MKFVCVWDVPSDLACLLQVMVCSINVEDKVEHLWSFAQCRLSKNHWIQVVKCRAHTSDTMADKNHWCSVKTRGSKASLQSQDAGLEACVSAELKACISAQSLKHASQTRKHHHGAQTWSSRPAFSIISMAKRKAQARFPTAEEPYVLVITTSLLGQVLPT